MATSPVAIVFDRLQASLRTFFDNGDVASFTTYISSFDSLTPEVVLKPLNPIQKKGNVEFIDLCYINVKISTLRDGHVAISQGQINPYAPSWMDRFHDILEWNQFKYHIEIDAHYSVTCGGDVRVVCVTLVSREKNVNTHLIYPRYIPLDLKDLASDLSDPEGENDVEEEEPEKGVAPWISDLEPEEPLFNDSDTETEDEEEEEEYYIDNAEVY